MIHIFLHCLSSNLSNIQNSTTVQHLVSNFIRDNSTQTTKQIVVANFFASLPTPSNSLEHTHIHHTTPHSFTHTFTMPASSALKKWTPNVISGKMNEMLAPLSSSSLPTSQVELTLSCRNLINTDLLSKSDPYIIVSMKEPWQDQYYEIGRTETINDTLNPQFVKKIILDYNVCMPKLFFVFIFWPFQSFFTFCYLNVKRFMKTFCFTHTKAFLLKKEKEIQCCIIFFSLLLFHQISWNCRCGESSLWVEIRLIYNISLYIVQ